MEAVLCDTCGNEVNARAEICPFCESPISRKATGETKKKSRITELLLKDGNPTVDEAINRLKLEIEEARKKRISLLRVIHGYGSSGAGGAIKPAVEQLLFDLKKSGAIKKYVTGEKHFEYAGKRNPLLRKYPELKEYWKTDRGNPGMTFVEI